MVGRAVTSVLPVVCSPVASCPSVGVEVSVPVEASVCCWVEPLSVVVCVSVPA